MWHQKQNNEMFSERVMGPLRPQGPHDCNNIVPAPSDVSDMDFPSESSRKRKSMVMDYPANAMPVATSQSVLGSNLLNESKHQDKSVVLSSTHEQANTKRGFSSPTPCFESGNMFQSVRYQDQSYPLTPNINKQNVPVAVADKRSQFHLSTQQDAFHQKEHTMNLPARTIPNLLDLQSTSGNFLSEIEAHKRPYPDQTGTSMENTFSVLGSLGLSFGNINHILNVNSSTDMCAKTTKLFSSSAVLLNNRVSDHAVNFDERLHNEDTVKTRSSLEMKLTEQTSYGERTMGVSTVGTSSLETAHREGNVTDQSCQSYNSEAIPTTGDNGVNSEQKLKDDYGKNDPQIMARKEGSVMENGDYSTGECNADNSIYVLAGLEHRQDSQYVACTLDGKSKSHAETATSVTEKLWEGSIQLSTSVTTSAVAFFKSGEKAPEITWSKSIAVKGKVRLEAFERFIQELPRSRSRGLMVISLRWMAGSSKTGLEGMKQVAKGYKEGDKVGYAQVSRTVDLYVCPRSDTIITILAKYGFFKGMAALEEDQDSLIGCVVWRRNQSSSDSTSKKSKTKTVPLSEQPFNSAPSSATVESDDTPLARPGKRVGLSSEATGGISESKSTLLNEVQTETVNLTSHNRSKKTHPVPDSSPVIPMGLNSYSQNNQTSSEIATPIIQSRGLEKPQAGLEIPKPVHASSCQNVTREKQQLAVDDDDKDDLPEFDFGVACGIVRHSVCKSPTLGGNVSDSVQLEIAVSTERANSTVGHMPSTLPAVQPTVIASQQRSQTIIPPTVSCGNEPSNPARELEEGKSCRPVMSSLDEKVIAHDSQRAVNTSTGLPARKNLWDDDDDMPEWCPPDQHQIRTTTVSTTLRSVPCVASPVPNPKPDIKLPGPPPPPPRPPVEAAAMRPSNSYVPVPVANWKPENPIPGPPPMANPRPPSLYLPSSDTNRKSENILPGPPPVRATSRPSFSYIASPMPNRNSENTLPGPPQRPRLPPPPPVSNHPQPQNGVNPPQSGPVGVQPPFGQSPSLGFTYMSAPRPHVNNFEIRPPVRPPGWRGWQS